MNVGSVDKSSVGIIPLHTAAASSLAQRVHACAMAIFQQIYDDIPGTRLVIGCIRYTLKTVREFKPTFGRRLGSPIGTLGCAAIYSVFKTPKGTLDSFREAKRSYAMGDREGLFFGAVNTATTLGNGLDASIVFTYSLKEILDDFHYVITVPKFMAKIFLPLDLALAAADIVTQGVNTYHTYKILKSVEEPGLAMMNELKHRIHAKAAEPSGAEETEINRHSSEKVYEAIKSGSYREEVKSFLHRKFNVDVADETINIVVFAALASFMFTAPYVGFSLLTICMIFKAAMYFNENSYLYKKSPHLIAS